jgi:hypothetical protein
MQGFPNVLQDFFRGLSRKAFPSNFRQSLYYLSPDEKTFIYDFRHDLTATDVPTVATGEFIIMDFTVPKDQVWIIKGFAPYAMERTNAGGVTQSARFIQPQDGNGWFAFTPVTAGGAPFVIQANYNAPQNDTGAQKDSTRQKSNGITQLSLTPYYDALQQLKDPFFSMPVFSNQQFQTIFSLMAPAATGGVALSNPYSIGTPTPPADKRVDWAGVCVAGLMMSENAYHEAENLFEKER